MSGFNRKIERINSLVTGLDEQTDIRIHKADLHRHVLPVRKNRAGIGATLLDEGEDVILNVERG